VAILDQFSSNKKVGQGIYKNIAAKQLFLDSELKKRIEENEEKKQAGAVKAAAILNDVRSKNEENTSKESSSVFQTVMAPLQQEQIRNNDNEDLPAAKRPKKA
jgi:polyphosphate kinase